MQTTLSTIGQVRNPRLRQNVRKPTAGPLVLATLTSFAQSPQLDPAEFGSMARRSDIPAATPLTHITTSLIRSPIAVPNEAGRVRPGR
jgi:hypothetical protein